MADPVGFRKGTIISYNPVTGANVIDVGGTRIVDIPVLGVAEVATYAAGASVGILVVETGGSQSWFIVGRIVRPSTDAYTEAVNALNNRTIADFDASSGTVVGTASYVDLSPGTIGPQVIVTVGSSGRLLVTVGCMSSFNNGPDPAPYDQIMSAARMTTAAEGANTWSGDGRWSLINYQQSLDTTTKRLGGFRATATHLFEGLDPGETHIVCKYSKATSGGQTTVQDRLLVVEPL
jgi:hypothetical protein